MTLFEQLERSPLGVWIAQSLWGYPWVLAAHAIGMAVVVGLALMLSARAFGFAREAPLEAFAPFSRIAFAGLTANIVTGFALFSGNATTLSESRPFLVKLALIAMGATLSYLLLQSYVRHHRAMNNRGKLLAGAAAIAWIGALVSGRLIAYIDAY